MRKQRFAFDKGEHEKDVHCLATPIKDHRGKVIAAISVSLPAFRMNANKKRELKEILIQMSENIFKRLGYNENRRITSVY